VVTGAATGIGRALALELARRGFRAQATPAWICNTGSEHSLGVPHLHGGVYTASKHAVLGLSDVLRRELPSNIGLSVLCPGVVRTEFWNAARHRPEALGGAPAASDEIAKEVIGHGMDANEIARRCICGVERGDFLIVTHPHARAFAEERWNLVREAFDAQAPSGGEEFDANRLVARVLAERRARRGAE